MTQDKSPGDDPQDRTFEQTLAGLEEIVARLESGELGLEESLRDFEQGVELLRGGYALLERAEQRIELLTGFDERGQPKTEPFDARATLEKERPSENADDSSPIP
ncbi:MAG: exodeoxyribonuclease VII small subunit [Planctomycetaceae bacterium]